jgi:hypothetical protein
MANELSFTVQAVVGRKDVERFTRKHNSQEREFYADLLSHLLKDKAGYEKLVINIAERGSCTRGKNLEDALIRTHERYSQAKGKQYQAQIKFNVQKYSSEPLLAVVDYALWTIQRVFERGEDRHYVLIKDKIRSVCDLYDTAKAGRQNRWQNYYNPDHPLTSSNRIG